MIQVLIQEEGHACAYEPTGRRSPPTFSLVVWFFPSNCTGARLGATGTPSTPRTNGYSQEKIKIATNQHYESGVELGVLRVLA